MCLCVTYRPSRASTTPSKTNGLLTLSFSRFLSFAEALLPWEQWYSPPTISSAFLLVFPLLHGYLSWSPRVSRAIASRFFGEHIRTCTILGIEQLSYSHTSIFFFRFGHPPKAKTRRETAAAISSHSWLYDSALYAILLQQVLVLCVYVVVEVAEVDVVTHQSFTLLAPSSNVSFSLLLDEGPLLLVLLVSARNHQDQLPSTSHTLNHSSTFFSPVVKRIRENVSFCVRT